MQRVTLYGQFLEGTEGYIIRRPSSDLNFKEVTFIEITISGVSTQITEEVSLVELYAYVNDASAPDAAYNITGDTISIFLKTATYAYAITTTFAVFGKRNALLIGSNVDIPTSSLELFINYCLSEAAQILGKPVPDLVSRNISDLEAAV